MPRWSRCAISSTYSLASAGSVPGSMATTLGLAKRLAAAASRATRTRLRQREAARPRAARAPPRRAPRASGRRAPWNSASAARLVDRGAEAAGPAPSMNGVPSRSSQVVPGRPANRGHPRPRRARRLRARVRIAIMPDRAARRRHPALVAVEMGGDVARQCRRACRRARPRSCRARRARDNRR